MIVVNNCLFFCLYSLFCYRLLSSVWWRWLVAWQMEKPVTVSRDPQLCCSTSYTVHILPVPSNCYQWSWNEPPKSSIYALPEQRCTCVWSLLALSEKHINATLMSTCKSKVNSWIDKKMNWLLSTPIILYKNVNYVQKWSKKKWMVTSHTGGFMGAGVCAAASSQCSYGIKLLVVYPTTQSQESLVVTHYI